MAASSSLETFENSHNMLYCVVSSSRSVSGIYAIRHIASGRVYVGSAVNIDRRWGSHRQALGSQRHCNAYLTAAWNKYGEGAFAFDVIETVADKSDLLAREQFHIDRLGATSRSRGFNISPTAGSPLGVRHTRETRDKLSVVRREQWNDPEYRTRLLAKRAETRGRKLSADQCRKMSVALRGKKRTPEQCATMSAARRGNVISPEHRAKLAVAATGKTQSEETRSKRKATMTGRAFSAEHVQHLRESQQRRAATTVRPPHSAETRAKIREARLRYWASKRAGAA